MVPKWRAKTKKRTDSDTPLLERDRKREREEKHTIGNPAGSVRLSVCVCVCAYQISERRHVTLLFFLLCDVYAHSCERETIAAREENQIHAHTKKRRNRPLRLNAMTKDETLSL